MGIEKPETSLASLIFPLPQGGLGQDSSEHLHQRHWHGILVFYYSFFLQIMFPVTGFAWESEVCPSSKKQEQQQWRFSNSGGIGNPQTWMSSAPLGRRTHLPQRSHCSWYQLQSEHTEVPWPKHAPFSTSMAQGWTATLKECWVFLLPDSDSPGATRQDLRWQHCLKAFE